MPLSEGASLGPYQITMPLGSGGMGEVYRALDPRLNRHVAIKILAPELAADTTALSRFEREAQALAALSHPGIVGVYDVGRHEHSAYVVMELLEGETVRGRITSGAVGVRRTVGYAIQMAHALAAAHDRGIVHRDLKPENVFLCHDGRVKILDFGIARLAADSAAITQEGVVRATPHITGPDSVVGSVGYMAPEQVRGQQVDARCDIFGLGAVTYEMLSGSRAFDGGTAADVIAAVLHSEPRDFDPGLRIPVALERIVRTCLEKRPADRFQSARDVALALDAVSGGSGTGGVVAERPARRVPWWMLAAVALLTAVLGLAAGRWLPSRVPAVASPGAVRFTFDANRGLMPEISVSPNGRHLAWTEITRGGQVGGLWVRRLDGTRPTLLADTPSGGTPFWSADSREVVVVGPDNQLLAIDVERGGRRILAELGPGGLPLRGGDWVGQTLLLGTGGLITAQDLSGRTGRRAVTSRSQPREAWHGWPVLLPDGRRFLYTVGLTGEGTETRIGSLDGGASVRVALPESTSRVLFDQRGFIVFGQNNGLFTQQFNPVAGTLQGSPVRLAPEVFQNVASGWIAADMSRNGVLAWRAAGVDEVQFELVDRAGRLLNVITQPDAFTNFDVLPDGSRIITTRRRRDDAPGALFLIDTARNLTTPIAERNAATAVSDPTWSPDGTQIAYRRGTHLVVRNTFGGEERVVADWPGYPDSWSRDGKYLIVGRPQPPDYQLWAVRVDGQREELPLVQGVSFADEARFSPDGKWVAFHAAVQGPPEVFVIRFPPTGERWQVSTGGGVQPRWSADGRELYYLGPDGQVMAVSMPGGDPTKALSPEPLFGLRIDPSPAFDQFAPVAGGQRFVIRRPLRPGGADTAPVHVLVNWLDSISASSPDNEPPAPR